MSEIQKVILIKTSFQVFFYKLQILASGQLSDIKNLTQNCYWLSPGRRIIPIGCHLEAGVKSPKKGKPAIGCHLVGG
jgi:hypothetical protein